VESGLRKFWLGLISLTSSKYNVGDCEFWPFWNLSACPGVTRAFAKEDFFENTRIWKQTGTWMVGAVTPRSPVMLSVTCCQDVVTETVYCPK
jgi:hypothetical protein